MARLKFDPLQMGRLMAQVWSDPATRQALVNRPRETLQAHGVDVGDHKIVVHEDTPSTVNVVIPHKPSAAAAPAMTEEQLRHIGRIVMDGCDS